MDLSLFLPFAEALLEAVMHGHWWAAVAAVLGFASVGLRISRPNLPVPLLVLILFAVSFVGGLANTIAAGTSLDLVAVRTALSIAFTAIGGWATLEVILRKQWPHLFPPREIETITGWDENGQMVTAPKHEADDRALAKREMPLLADPPRPVSESDRRPW